MAGAVGLSATACGGPGGGDVTLKLVAADYGTPQEGNGSQVYWDRLVEAFHEEHPDIGVDVTVLSWNEVDKAVADMVAAGDAPDIAQIGAYADYAAGGDLYSASELLSIPVQADFLPGLARAGELRRTQYGLPFVSSTRLLFYNKTLFARAGLDPEAPPVSWAELRTAARALKEAGVRIPYGLPLGPEEAPAETMMWMLSGGGGYTDNVGSYTIDSAENVRTFTWLRDELVRTGLTGPQAPGETDRQEVFDAFAAGEVGMLNGHPTLMSQAAEGDVDYGTAPLPGRLGAASATMGVADWIMGFKQNGHREEIGAFLDFVFSVEQHYAFTERYDLLPVTTSASDRMSEDDVHRDLRPFLEQLPVAEFYPVDKVSWAQTSQDIKNAIGEAVAPGGSPENVLGSLQRKAWAEESAAPGGR
ncbi:extracellular solute-binding protein [Streptomyces sp. TRM 70351]|uniref:extracellular solute-binding protein n=1 Tax=Streptomyces sp. TRM 70351 TaxID=3116552 RepID=UPI002E7BDA72|nr:extracellular solute-binding protein [Streptomyces sp. TRM 70351]MEE1929665.1 extracellular solute-binding protein [Streptomyces sp. TRM 70351]